jgi:hypothetical protein
MNSGQLGGDLAAIKGDPALAATPVVLMSIVDQRNRGYALGAADYLVKPVYGEFVNHAAVGIWKRLRK